MVAIAFQTKTSMLRMAILCAVVTCIDGGIARPRGVSPSKASFYQPGPDETFTCLHDGKKIPFVHVNDDYCDCTDGTDEPGTSACSNMKFYCANKGHTPEYIFTSRVNDGICDCCDGTDEFSGDKIECKNSCDELGRKNREEREKQRELHNAGYKIKLEYMQKAHAAEIEKKERLEELEKQKEVYIAERDVLEASKNAAELPEKEAKEQHEKAWNEKKAAIEAEKDRAKAVQAFNDLDTNDDNHVVAHELMAHPSFDKDKDGSVSMDEAKEYLEELERAGMDDFVEKIWPNIKEIYKSHTPEEPQEGTQEPTETKTEVGDTDTVKPPTAVPPFENQMPPVPVDTDNIEEGREEEHHGDDDDDHDDDDGEDEFDQHESLPVEKKDDEMPDFDEETKKLIEAADEARKQYNEADSKVRDAENEINGLKKYLELDYGPDGAFGVLKDQCFEYTDREYTYKLCLFDKASQRPKSGGSETSLGNWGHWDGPEDNKYMAQKYERGQNCWNGPDRSAKVILHCGTENQLTSASEPSRCEYHFDFSTPAICSQSSADEEKSDIHDEL